MANPVTHLEKTIAGEVQPVTHLEQVIAEYGGGGGGGTSDYTQLTNKPQINSVTLTGNKSLDDLGIQSALSKAQLAAVNSGITPEDVEQIGANENNILSIQDHIKFTANSKTYYLQPEQPQNPSEGDIWIG